jgi:hypothetical protein
MPAQAELRASHPRVDKRAILSAHPLFKGLGSELIDQVGSHAVNRAPRRDWKRRYGEPCGAPHTNRGNKKASSRANVGELSS